MVRAQQAEPAKLTSLRSIYEENRKGIHARYADPVAKWPERYLEALRALQKRFQVAGDLESWKVAQAEAVRFQQDRDVTARSVVPRPQDLRDLQLHHGVARLDLTLARDRGLLDLHAKYVGALTRLQTDLTREGEIEAALKVNRELERARASSEVKTMEADCDRAEADKAAFLSLPPPAAPEPPTPPSPPPDTAKPPRSGSDDKPSVETVRPPSKEWDGFKFYEDAMPPALAGVKFATLTLRPTENQKAGSRIGVGCLIGERTKAAAPTVHCRLTLRSSSAMEATEGVLLAIEYYGRDLATDSAAGGQPQRIAEQLTTLPPLGAASLYVDCPPVTPGGAGAQFLGAFAPAGGTTKADTAFYGLILTLFGPDKSLIYQGASMPRLCSTALAQYPSQAEAAHAKAKLERAEAALKQAQDAQRAKPDDADAAQAVKDATDARDAARKAVEDLQTQQSDRRHKGAAPK
jgi:hypothetical protein